MSSSPLKPLGHPSRPQSRSVSTQSNPNGSQGAGDRMGSSSASSSQTAGPQSSRADQIMYRFYLKTVGVLGEGRLTHFGSSSVAKGGEDKKDKWFNLSLPESDLHKSDLQIYRSISSYPVLPASATDPGGSSIPPLLVAFILDTSDLPNGLVLMWNRSSGRFRIDTSLAASNGKGKEVEKKSGIILERWTFQAGLSNSSSSSHLPPHTAYRHGIIHFRALFALIRLLPAYRLHRRLRRANNGLRLGIKLWGPEGFPNSVKGLEEAWEIMERGLVGLDEGLETLVVGDTNDEREMERHAFPSLDLFGMRYDLGVEYRPEVDFQVEDMESVLSEKFVDMDEDWFKPTVARHRTDSETSLAAIPTSTNLSSSNRPNRGFATSIGIPSNPSPIPLRQQAAPIGSFSSPGDVSSSSRPSEGRVSSGVTIQGSSSQKKNVGSLGTEKWGLLAEGLPFASGMSGLASENSSKEPASPTASTNPSGAMITARRLSAHSIHPFRSSLALSSSPSASILRGTPPSSGSPAMRLPTGSHPSSIGRTSSFLSQSGRSFTHAQMANMQLDNSPSGGGASGRNVISSSPPPHSPNSPSSLSFTKQTFPRSLSGRNPQLYPGSSGSSPFIPSSLEQESNMMPLKRHSSSISQKDVPLGSANASGPLMGTTSGSQGSSGDGRSLPGSTGHSLLRRTSTRESTLRRSIEGNRTTSIRTPPADEDEIQAFLKTLDSLPQPPSLAAQTVYRPNLPSTSSSLTAPSIPPSPSGVPTFSSSVSQGQSQGQGRAPLTRTQVDDALRKMAGSFNLKIGGLEMVNSGLISQSTSQTPSRLISESSSPSGGYGLLTSSRPDSTALRMSPSRSDNPTPPQLRRTPSGGSSPSSQPRMQSIKAGSPLSLEPMQPAASDRPLHPQSQSNIPTSKPFQAVPQSSSQASQVPGTARSLPPGGSHALIENSLLPVRSPSGAGPELLSPQTTGGLGFDARTSGSGGRRGPVLLRGGFGQGTTKTSTSSPSHSPIRDFARVQREREREREKDNQRDKDTGARRSTVERGRGEDDMDRPLPSGGGIGNGNQSGYKAYPIRASLSPYGIATGTGPTSGLQSLSHGPVDFPIRDSGPTSILNPNANISSGVGNGADVGSLGSRRRGQEIRSVDERGRRGLGISSETVEGAGRLDKANQGGPREGRGEGGNGDGAGCLEFEGA